MHIFVFNIMSIYNIDLISKCYPKSDAATPVEIVQISRISRSWHKILVIVCNALHEHFVSER